MILKDVELGLKTAPVGAFGVETTSGTEPPLPVCRLATSAPSFAIQNGLVVENAIPHGFTRFTSVFAAAPGMSEARLVWRNPTLSAKVRSDGNGITAARVSAPIPARITCSRFTLTNVTMGSPIDDNHVFACRLREARNSRHQPFG